MKIHVYLILFFIRIRITKSILNGVAVAEKEYPFFVCIELDSAVVCGGTIITPSVVVTGAHCVIQMDKEKTFIPVEINRLMVLAGTVTLDQSDQGYQESQVDNLIIHEKFNPLHGMLNNIAILDLTYDLLLDDWVNVAREPTELKNDWKQLVKNGTECTVMGFGYISVNKDLPTTLMKSLISISCPKDFIISGYTCAVMTSPKSGLCLGDLGSPVVCLGYVYGFISHSYLCQQEVLPVYILLFENYLDFLPISTDTASKISGAVVFTFFLIQLSEKTSSLFYSIF
ncbi:neutrophil elastase-like [Cimex lectularius]|uniref:Peptidase S1 domain-containing protein n=1 Tax=Cimex lectularius TaxID=79782 RepID=A0A8I6RJG7_CIMLE|nr:neutrophil elastase-like [Cimex lectularius]